MNPTTFSRKSASGGKERERERIQEREITRLHSEFLWEARNINCSENTEGELEALHPERTPPPHTPSSVSSIGERGPRAGAHGQQPVLSQLCLPLATWMRHLTRAQPPLAGAAARFVFKRDSLCLGYSCWRILW